MERFPDTTSTESAERISNGLSLSERFARCRETSVRLCDPLSAEDCAVQSMPDASPTKWHLAHSSWFFETFILSSGMPGYRRFHPDFEYLFNSYYNAVGEQYPRPCRQMLTRPSMEGVLAFRKYVDEKVIEFLGSCNTAEVDKWRGLIELGIHHEQQHQELILTDIKHLLSCNPLFPAYQDENDVFIDTSEPPPAQWRHFSGGVHRIGNNGESFGYDNEMPRHEIFLHDYSLSSRLVSNGEFMTFIKDRGYGRPEFWLSDGWRVVQDRHWKAPLYWIHKDGKWHEFTLSGLRPVRQNEPACHVSFYEADAYARWAGARLPAESEWEVALMNRLDDSVPGRLLEDGQCHPGPAPEGDGRKEAALSQMYGDAWEWTASPYTAYPNYSPSPGALGEYNAKFMCNQMVLRGGSCATPRSSIRPTYRNFFPPDARWQFSGFRLAKRM